MSIAGVTPADLWQRTLAAPADADLKAQYLHALTQAGDPRGAICDLAAEYRLAGGSYPDRGAAAKARLDPLLAAWSAELAPAAAAWHAQVHFATGWPSELTIDAADFVSHAAEIVATLPIRHLNLVAISATPAVFAVPQLEQIASLDGRCQQWSDEALRALTTSEHLGALRWLDLSGCSITEAQVDVLAAAPALRTLKLLDLSDNPARDPVDGSAGAGISWETNTIIPDSVFLPAFGTELEARHGKIPWLHALSTYLDDYPPSRYIF